MRVALDAVERVEHRADAALCVCGAPLRHVALRDDHHAAVLGDLERIREARNARADDGEVKTQRTWSWGGALAVVLYVVEGRARVGEGRARRRKVRSVMQKASHGGGALLTCRARVRTRRPGTCSRA